jgi:hypothetical protein
MQRSQSCFFLLKWRLCNYATVRLCTHCDYAPMRLCDYAPMRLCYCAPNATMHLWNCATFHPLRLCTYATVLLCTHCDYATVHPLRLCTNAIVLLCTHCDYAPMRLCYCAPISTMHLCDWAVVWFAPYYKQMVVSVLCPYTMHTYNPELPFCTNHTTIHPCPSPNPSRRGCACGYGNALGPW